MKEEEEKVKPERQGRARCRGPGRSLNWELVGKSEHHLGEYVQPLEGRHLALVGEWGMRKLGLSLKRYCK